MDFTSIFAGSALIGILAGCWNYIKSFAWRLVGIFIRRMSIPVDEDGAARVLLHYMRLNYRLSGIRDQHYHISTFVTRRRRCELVAYEDLFRCPMVFWAGWWPIFVHVTKEKTPNSGDNGRGNEEMNDVRMWFVCLRGTINLEDLIVKACAHMDIKERERGKGRRRFFIMRVPNIKMIKDQRSNAGSTAKAWAVNGARRVLTHDPDDIGTAAPEIGTALPSLVLSDKLLELVEEVRFWLNNKNWYKEHGIPWKRGWLLYGPPGSGKTALTRAIAEDLDLPIYVWNLAGCSNSRFVETWDKMKYESPVLALIEDIDNVFHGRRNISMPLLMGGFHRAHVQEVQSIGKQSAQNEQDSEIDMAAPLTFDCLLNTLDGVEDSEGIFTVVTTNDVSKIDEALGRPRRLPDGTVEVISSRPGRIDKAIELGYMTPENKEKLAERILFDFPEELEEMRRFIWKTGDTLQETPAQFQERCASVALSSLYRKRVLGNS